MSDAGLDIVFDEFYHSILALLVVDRADLGGDGEAGRNGKSQQVHFGQVGPLTAEQVFHVCFPFGFSIAERVNILCVAHNVFGLIPAF